MKIVKVTMYVAVCDSVTDIQNQLEQAHDNYVEQLNLGSSAGFVTDIVVSEPFNILYPDVTCEQAEESDEVLQAWLEEANNKITYMKTYNPR